MIEELTEQKLIEYGFSEDTIKRIFTLDNYVYQFENYPKGTYWASGALKKIYSGKDAVRKIYFENGNNIEFPYYDLNLISEYYDLKQNVYLKKQEIIAGSSFTERSERDKFKAIEMKVCKETIEALKANPQMIQDINGTKERINKFDIYLTWLNDKIEYKIEPANPKDKKPIVSIDAMTLIKASKQQAFIAIHEKLIKELPFKSAIRCAAFCTLLFGKDFFINQKNRKVMMNNFAVNKYGVDIYTSLASSKKEHWGKYQTQTIRNLPPLKNYF